MWTSNSSWYPNAIENGKPKVYEHNHAEITEERGKYQIFDSQGRVVKHGQLQLGPNQVLDTYENFLTPGIYIIQVKTTNQSFQQKISI